jgi:hypothetical protein
VLSGCSEQDEVLAGTATVAGADFVAVAVAVVVGLPLDRAERWFLCASFD